MSNNFRVLPQNASLDAIYGKAGKLFEERKRRNQQTQFSTEIWYLAGDAIDCGFDALKGMTKEQVARGMSNSILSWVGEEHRFAEDIRRAVARGQLPERFRPGDVRRACPGWGWADYIYDVFLLEHSRGYTKGRDEYFVLNPGDTYSLIR